MTMTDDKGRDDKIIAVHVDDPEYEHYHDISELPPIASRSWSASSSTTRPSKTRW